MTKKQQIRKLYKAYKDESQIKEVDMHKFAAWLDSKGWRMPEPKDPLEILAKQCADAIREEVRIDPNTGHSYKANIAFSPNGDAQGMLWVDTDEEKRRHVMVKCLKQRRDQMVGDAYSLCNDSRPMELKQS